MAYLQPVFPNAGVWKTREQLENILKSFPNLDPLKNVSVSRDLWVESRPLQYVAVPLEKGSREIPSHITVAIHVGRGLENHDPSSYIADTIEAFAEELRFDDECGESLEFAMSYVGTANITSSLIIFTIFRSDFNE